MLGAAKHGPSFVDSGWTVDETNTALRWQPTKGVDNQMLSQSVYQKYTRKGFVVVELNIREVRRG